MNKKCPKCYGEFMCHADNITACLCTHISFTEDERKRIARIQQGCLCPKCLAEIRTNFDKPARIRVSFQDAQYDYDLLILAKEDTIIDSHGNEIELFEGKKVAVYEFDLDENDVREDIIASGIVEKNVSDFKAAAKYKWSLRVDENGIRHES
jgi:hypothetical protein